MERFTCLLLLVSPVVLAFRDPGTSGPNADAVLQQDKPHGLGTERPLSSTGLIESVKTAADDQLHATGAKLAVEGYGKIKAKPRKRRRRRREHPIMNFNAQLSVLSFQGYAGLVYMFGTSEGEEVWSGTIQSRHLIRTLSTKRTGFPFASASKLYTGFAAMLTMERKPSLFYPTKFIHEFKGWETFRDFPVHGWKKRANLTIHHLLTHTSGLPFAMRNSKSDIEGQRLFFWPGTQWGYTLGHRVLGWLLRDFWLQQAEVEGLNLKTVGDVYKWLMFDELGFTGTEFKAGYGHLFGWEGDAGDAAIESTAEDFMKLAVVALRRGSLPSGRVLISEHNWNKWAIPNLLPDCNLTKDLVSWQGPAASWKDWNVGGVKGGIMKQTGEYGWNYFGATYLGSQEVGWCGFFSSCLRVSYAADVAFVMVQRDVADVKRSKPILNTQFQSMARSLQCRQTGCRNATEEDMVPHPSVFCHTCTGPGNESCVERPRHDGECMQRSIGMQNILIRSVHSWSIRNHSCFVPRCRPEHGFVPHKCWPDFEVYRGKIGQTPDWAAPVRVHGLTVLLLFLLWAVSLA